MVLFLVAMDCASAVGRIRMERWDCRGARIVDGGEAAARFLSGVVLVFVVMGCCFCDCCWIAAVV